MNHSGIVTPHEHDVLSGRGNFVNYHAGNEHFRNLVKNHKVAYVACPKPQKGKFSRMIVDEIRSRNPPGRFLKQDPATKLWYDIGEKKALDKTRQALREGAPEIMKEMGGGEDDDAFDQPDSAYRSSTADTKVPSNSHQMATPRPESNPPETVVSRTDRRQHTHPGQFAPEPVPIPFDDPSPIDPSTSIGDRRYIGQPPQMLMQQQMPMQQHMSMQQQMPVRPHVNSNPAPQRIMRGGLGSGHGVVPVRSLAAIRQAMQLQAQRNNIYLQQQYQQNRDSQYAGTADVGTGGYPGMTQAMMDQLEPRPIGPGSGNVANGAHGINYEKTPGKPEIHEQVGPLPGPVLSSRVLPGTRKDFHREGSDRSINVDKVFGSSGHSRTMENSTISVMSLSVGEIVEKFVGEDGKSASGDMSDPDQLATLFDSSVRLGSGEKKRKPPARTGSGDGQDASKVMDMSVMSLGMSEIGDASVAQMTESNNAMSFTDVFERSDH